MEQHAWTQLLDELKQYIDTNHVGKRLLPSPADVVKHGGTAKNYSAHCAPLREQAISSEDDSMFMDILKIFEDDPFRESAESAVPAGDIDSALDFFEDTETFSEALLRIIREKELIEADVYNRVFMDRKLFSKIRNDRTYRPSKRTALLLSVALQLSISETQSFLNKAGFTMTHTSKTDIIVEFFMLRGNYDVMEINAALHEHRLPPLN